MDRARPPFLPRHLEVYWEAFWYLSRRRSYNAGGPNPITVESIIALADNHQHSKVPGFKRRMLQYIADMDDCYLEHYYAQQQKKNTRGGA